MQTEIEKLPELVEAILFVAGQGVEIKDIAEKLEVDAKQIKEAIEALKEKHINDGINVITYKNSVQMCSNSVFAEDIAVVLNPIREKQLTKAALETLAIIAYKQPITKLEIEQVRNVNSDYAMQVLTNFKLVEVVGRKDAVGKPLLYGTTDEFLKHFNLQDIDDLPDYDEILERIEIIHAEAAKSDSLYGSTEIIPEDQLADAKTKQDNEKTTENTKNTNVSQDNTTSNTIEEPIENIDNKDASVEEGEPLDQAFEDDKEESANALNTENLDNANDEQADSLQPDQPVENENIINNNDKDTNEENLEEIKETLLKASKADEDAIIDSFRDTDTL